jgi:hypothetical protein
MTYYNTIYTFFESIGLILLIITILNNKKQKNLIENLKNRIDALERSVGALESLIPELTLQQTSSQEVSFRSLRHYDCSSCGSSYNENDFLKQT